MSDVRSAGDVDATFELTLKMRNSPIWNVRAHQKVSERFQKVGPRRVRRPNAWAAGEKRLATPIQGTLSEIFKNGENTCLFLEILGANSHEVGSCRFPSRYRVELRNLGIYLHAAASSFSSKYGIDPALVL